MILDSPCKTYLKALLAQGWSVQRVEEHACELKLDYVSLQFLVYLAETSLPPEIFRPKDLHHKPSQDYLQQHRLTGLVPSLNPPAQAAFHLLQKPKARELLEVLGLARATPAERVRALADARIRTSLEVVEFFERMFWDVEAMDGVTLRAVLQLRSARLELLPGPGSTPALEGGGEGGAELPHPHRTDPPTHADKIRARSRRANKNQGLYRELEKSQSPEQKQLESHVLRKAAWSDPRLVLASMPPSPLTVSLGRALAGLPLSRLELSKAYEVLLVMATHRIATSIHDNHPEASTRFAQYTAGALNLLKLQKELGSNDISLRNQVQAIVLQSRSPGVYGEPEVALGPGTFQLSPYSKQDLETANEMRSGKPKEKNLNDKAVVSEDKEE